MSSTPMQGHEWKKGLSDEGRCGTCLFVEGGWEVEFRDGKRDYCYYCNLVRIVTVDDREYVWLNGECHENYVCHFQRACENYRNIHKYTLLISRKFKHVFAKKVGTVPDGEDMDIYGVLIRYRVDKRPTRPMPGSRSALLSKADGNKWQSSEDS